MELTLQNTLQKVVCAHNQGNLTEAQGLFLSILQGHLDHPEANHNLGAITVSLNKVALALSLFKSALKANPKKVQNWVSYNNALIKENDHETSKAALEQGERRCSVIVRLKH